MAWTSQQVVSGAGIEDKRQTQVFKKKCSLYNFQYCLMTAFSLSIYSNVLIRYRVGYREGSFPF